MIIKRNKWIVYFFVYVCLYVYHFIVIKFPGDDFDVSNASQHYNLYQWLVMRYFKWSGRLFPDGTSLILIPDKVWLWRILNPLFFIILAYGFVRIWKKNVRIIEFLTALFMLGYIKDNVLSSGFFWITGSMYYLWAVSLGLFAMIPYADQVFRKETINTFTFIMCLPFGFLASISNEQASLCMTCFAILSHIVLFRQKIKTDKRLILLTLAIIIGTCILIFAPGSRIRYVQEVARWYPGFDHLTLKEHFYIGTIWGFEKLFNDMKYFGYILSIILVIPYFKNRDLRKNPVFRVFFLVLCMMLLIDISGFDLKLFYNFEEIRHFRFSRFMFSGSQLVSRNFMLAVFPYLFWGLYSFMLIYLLLKSTNRKIFVLFCLLAVIASLVVMFFSPTIYASRNRVLTVPAILLGIIIIGRIKEHELVSRPLYLCVFAAFPIINLAHMLYIWITKGFTPFL